ncbi:hypothetical protein [Geminicoccus roseus]|uniref:hypothetical protein n=1 Tax=Geminicoccus roseus TaxID=404900 RepID=UPI000429AB25|nr:hypothetical protein [Geminicoccus roseus]
MNSRPSEIWSRDFAEHGRPLQRWGALLTRRGKLVVGATVMASGLVIGIFWADLI